jgi:hypothetical protein
MSSATECIESIEHEEETRESAAKVTRDGENTNFKT